MIPWKTITPEEEANLREFMYTHVITKKLIGGTRDAAIYLFRTLARRHIDRVLSDGDRLLSMAKAANCDRTSSKVLPDQNGKTLSP